MEARKRRVLGVVCLATVLVILSINLPSVILPALGDELRASFAEQQWVINAYALSLAALLLTAGSLADRLGRKRIFVWGLVWFLLSSLLCGLAWEPVVLDLARGAQGVGGAALFAGSLALLAQEFRGAERGRALGVWSAAIAASIAVGPLVGGALTETFGWRWAFFLCVALTLPAIPLAIANLSESRDPEAGGIDWIGVATLATGVFFLVFALVGGNDRGWGSPMTLITLALGVVLLAAYLLVEKVERQPMLDLSLFRVPTFVGASLVAFFVSAAIFATLVFAPRYFIDAGGVSPFGAGLRLLPFALSAFLASVTVGRIADRLSPRIFIGVGMSLVGVGLTLLYGVDPNSEWTRLAPGLAVSGVGLGLVNPLLAAAALGVVGPERSGMAAGINNTFRQLGAAFGVAGLGAVLQGVQTRASRAGVNPAQAFVDGFNEVLLFGAAIAFVGALLAVALVRSQDYVASTKSPGPEDG